MALLAQVLVLPTVMNKVNYSLENLEKELDIYVNLEVGSFISVQKGAGIMLYRLLPQILYERKCHYVLFTLTRKVKSLFDRLLYKTTYLADADIEKVPNKETWGSFYDTSPKTYVMDIRKSLPPSPIWHYAETMNIFIKH